MTAIPGDLAVQAWKDQLEAAVRLLEAITEGSRNLREAQLKAATEAHAAAQALRERIARSTRQFYAPPVVSAPQVRQSA